MRVRNIHIRRFTAAGTALGPLLDSLASDDDGLWPHQRWPAMRFDRPLTVGATGGHGPVRYHVVAYQPGKSVRFRFTAPRGFDGYHEFSIATVGATTELRHVLEARMRNLALVTWPLVFRPLHDALLEDSLDRAELAVTGTVRTSAKWSRYVRALRWLLARGTHAKAAAAVAHHVKTGAVTRE